MDSEQFSGNVMISAFLLLSFSLTHVAFPPAVGPLENPMKGFASYCDPGRVLSCPSEMAFEETGWDRVEPEEGRYAFDRWERELWDVPPAKGKHIVIRIYLDYPGQPSSVPKWLIAKGVRMTRYDEFGGGETPDYGNPRLRESLLKLIAEMGRRYDHDPRIDFVQLGLLGHWGEWHDYPHENLFASAQVQREVIEAMHRAFPDKPLMARNASYPSCQLPWLGFHDDMIPSDTFGTEDWEFIPAMIKGKVAENWKRAPTGGEMVPGAAKQYLGKDYDLLMRSVKEAHFTWIGPYCPAMEGNLTDEDRGRVAELLRTLGYQFQLSEATYPTQVSSGQTFDFVLNGRNQGVAPFYQPWKVRLALLDGDGRAVRSWDTGSDVRTWLPGRFEVRDGQRVSAPPGRYSLGLGIIDPATGKPAIRFANDLDTLGGYTVLGMVEVVKPLTR